MTIPLLPADIIPVPVIRTSVQPGKTARMLSHKRYFIGYRSGSPDPDGEAECVSCEKERPWKN